MAVYGQNNRKARPKIGILKAATASNFDLQRIQASLYWKLEAAQRK
jgi:hypothetical protein